MLFGRSNLTILQRTSDRSRLLTACILEMVILCALHCLDCHSLLIALLSQINVPIGAAATAICFFALPLKPVTGDVKTKLKQVDYGGATLVLISTILVLVALNLGGQARSWDDALVLSTIIVGLSLWFGLFFYEWKIASLPIIPLKTFKIRTVAGEQLLPMEKLY